MNEPPEGLMKFLKKRGVIIAILGLSIALACVTMYHRSVVKQYESELARILRQSATNRFALWRYGTIETVNTADKTIIIAIGTNFGNERISRNFRVHITSETLLQKQTFARRDNVITGIASIEPASFEEIRPGMGASIAIDGAGSSNTLIARSLVIGDPL